jgi:arylsulfatase A-like enzyme
MSDIIIHNFFWFCSALQADKPCLEGSPKENKFYLSKIKYYPCLLFLLFYYTSQCQKNTKPVNVVFILIDDLGYTDIGCYGSSFYETPNIDRLASIANKFTNGYAASPVCSPTRASIMSGMYPSTIKNTDWFGAPQPEKAKLDKYWSTKPLLPASYSEAFSLSNYTIAEAFKDKGYATMIAGKWHLGESESLWPEHQGFDINKGGFHKGHPASYFSPYSNPKLSDGPTGEYLGDRLTTEATNFISSQKGKPFFLYFPMYEVHTPIQAKEELIKKYEAKRARLGLEDKFINYPGGKTRSVQSSAKYAAMVETMDACVGKLMKSLEENQLMENTVIVFTSDNGGLSTSEGQPTSNLPLRAGKGWVYEGGVRVPYIIKLPNQNKMKVIDEPVMSIDLYPTLIDLAGIKSSTKVDGKSLKNVMQKNGDLGRDLFWHYPHYGNQGGAPSAAIRSGCMKLVFLYETSEYELYNLCDDVSESKDLAKSQPKVAKKLLKKLLKWQLRSKVNLPTKNV